MKKLIILLATLSACLCASAATYTNTEVDEAVKQSLTPVGLEVYLTASETFTGVQNTLYSPGANVALTGDLTDSFGYVGGQIEYTGLLPVKVLFESVTTLSANGISVDLEFGLAKNTVLETNSIQATTTHIANSPKELSTQKVFDLVTGDNLDFYIRQTSSATTTITIHHGTWVVTKIKMN